MKKGLSYVAIVLGITACLAFGSYLQAEGDQVNTIHPQTSQQNQTKGIQETKEVVLGWPPTSRPVIVININPTATTLEVVVMEGCPPCYRMKRDVIPRLRKQGYNVIIVDIRNDKHRSSLTPTLYYLNKRGQVLRREIGFHTAAQIKRYLRRR